MRESATNYKFDVPTFHESRYAAESPAITARIVVSGKARPPAR